MANVVPILMMMLFGALALVLYLGRQREEAGREEALNRRIQIFVPAPAAEARAQLDRARARARPGRPMIITWDPLRNLERWLAQAGLEMRPTRFLLVILVMELAGTALSAMWLDSKMAGLCGTAFAAIPVVYLVFKRKGRLATFSQQLPYMRRREIACNAE